MLSKHLVNRTKRSSIVLMTNEARVLKELREAAGLSMRKAGELIGKSDSYISHLENGRMNIPPDDQIVVILQVYGGIKPKSFRERARKMDSQKSEKSDIEEWLSRSLDSDIKLVHKFIFGYLSER